MAGYTGTYDEDQVNSGGLLGPELTTQVGVKGRQAGDDIKSKLLSPTPINPESVTKFLGPEAVPPEPLKNIAEMRPMKAPEVKPMSSFELPGRAARAGYPNIPETRSTSESSIGPEYRGDQPAIPEAPATGAPLEKGWTRRPGEGIDYKLGPEDKAGDEMARRRMEAESNSQFGEPTHARSTMNIGGKSYELAGGRTLAEKEEQEGKPQDFDFSTYKKALEAIGGKPSLKMQTDVLGLMYGEHTRREDIKAKMREIEKTHGEGSPQMIAAKSEARLRDIQGQMTIAKAPAEVQHLLSESAHLIAQTQRIPYEEAHMQAQSNYWTKMANAPELRADKGALDDLIKLHDSAFGDPKRQKDYADRIEEILNKTRAKTFVDQYNASHGTKISADQIRWNGEKWVEAK